MAQQIPWHVHMTPCMCWCDVMSLVLLPPPPASDSSIWFLISFSAICLTSFSRIILIYPCPFPQCLQSGVCPFEVQIDCSDMSIYFSLFLFFNWPSSVPSRTLLRFGIVWSFRPVGGCRYTHTYSSHIFYTLPAVHFLSPYCNASAVPSLWIFVCDQFVFIKCPIWGPVRAWYSSRSLGSGVSQPAMFLANLPILHPSLCFLCMPMAIATSFTLTDMTYLNPDQLSRYAIYNMGRLCLLTMCFPSWSTYLH